MKSLSIGRDKECDIVLTDHSDVISRRHAVLNIYPSGKMAIIDYGRNGTYVNGVKITSDVQVPVTRKDIISFAHVRQLDWEQIPKANTWMKYLIFSLLAIIIAAGAYFSIDHFLNDSGKQISSPDTVCDSIKTEPVKTDTVKTDTVKTNPNKTPVKKEPVKKDTVKTKEKQEKQKDSKAENAKKLPTF